MQLNNSVVLVLLLNSCSIAFADDWAQWRGANREGLWSETGIRDELPEGQLPIDWSVNIGSGYSGPTVADGRVFITDRKLTEDRRQLERILCFRVTDGEPLWEHSYEANYSISYTAGPRASVTIDGDAVYAVGAMGHFHCMNAKSGEILWQKDLQTEFKIEMPIWGIAASPLVYQDLVVQQVGGADGACIVAFKKSSGDEVWRALKERAGYSSPIIIQQAGHDVLVCWTGDSLSGLDPNTGKVYWAHSFPPSRMPIGIATPVTANGKLYVSSFYDGSLMVTVPADKLVSEVVWRAVGTDEQHTESLHCMIGTPILTDRHVYGVDSYGEFRCLNANTGERIWESDRAVPRERWATIHMVHHGDDVWMFNERGELLIAQLSPEGLAIQDHCQVIEPTKEQLPRRGGVCWSHPAFAEQSIFARNDNRLVKASLKK